MSDAADRVVVALKFNCWPPHPDDVRDLLNERTLFAKQLALAEEQRWNALERLRERCALMAEEYGMCADDSGRAECGHHHYLKPAAFKAKYGPLCLKAAIRALPLEETP